MKDFCKKCKKPISNFSRGAETKYVALDGKVGWNCKISLQIETLCSGLHFDHTSETWEKAGGTSAVSPFSTLSLIHLIFAVQRDRQGPWKIGFPFAFWHAGSGGNRDLHQEQHNRGTASFQGAEKLSAQHQRSTMYCYHCREVQKIPSPLFISADKIQTTKVLRCISFSLPSSSKWWSVPSFKSSSTHGWDRGLLLVSCFSFSLSVFFSITPIKIHIMAIKTGVREEKSAMIMEQWSLPSK